MATTTKYRWVGNHAEQISVGDKRVPVGPGDFVNLNEDDLENEDNTLWLDSNLLIDASEKGGGK